MSMPRLSPSSYVVLGWVSFLGKPTTYDIRRHVNYSVGELWPFPQSQLYAETARLAAAGLLAEEREQGGRHRRHYSITDKGRQAIADWLADPTSEAAELRHGGLLKLFFSELATTEQVVALARTQEAWHREQLATYQATSPASPTAPTWPAGWRRHASASPTPPPSSTSGPTSRPTRRTLRLRAEAPAERETVQRPGSVRTLQAGH